MPTTSVVIVTPSPSSARIISETKPHESGYFAGLVSFFRSCHLVTEQYYLHFTEGKWKERDICCSYVVSS